MTNEYYLKRLFRAFNRVARDRAFKNYMDELREFNPGTVRSAVEQLVDESWAAMPTPAAVRKYCKIHASKGVADACFDCKGKGHLVDEQRYFDSGMDNICYGTSMKCSCNSPIEDSPRLVSKQWTREWAGAMRIAKAMRGRSSDQDFYSKWWTDETRGQWHKRAVSIDSEQRIQDVILYINNRVAHEDARTAPLDTLDKTIPISVGYARRWSEEEAA